MVTKERTSCAAAPQRNGRGGPRRRPKTRIRSAGCDSRRLLSALRAQAAQLATRLSPFVQKRYPGVLVRNDPCELWTSRATRGPAPPAVRCPTHPEVRGPTPPPGSGSAPRALPARKKCRRREDAGPLNAARPTYECQGNNMPRNKTSGAIRRIPRVLKTFRMHVFRCIGTNLCKETLNFRILPALRCIMR